MVMVHNSSDSEVDEGRHDRFRGERILKGPSEYSADDGSGKREERRRRRSRSPIGRRDRRREERWEDRRDERREEKREEIRSYWEEYGRRERSHHRDSPPRQRRDRSSRSGDDTRRHSRKKRKKHHKKEKSHHRRRSSGGDRSPLPEGNGRVVVSSWEESQEEAQPADDLVSDDCKSPSSRESPDVKSSPGEESVQMEVPESPQEICSSGSRTPSDTSEVEEDCIGPTKPTEESTEIEVKELRMLGPERPSEEQERALKEAGESYGPALPPRLSAPGQEEEEEEPLGPLPPGEAPLTTAHIQLHQRALAIKTHMDKGGGSEEKDPKEREAWMTELPEQRSIIGDVLAPRKFRHRDPAPTDHSWAQAPHEKEEDKKKKDETRPEGKSRRDEEMEKEAKRLNKKRTKSLMEQHQKQLRKKKKKEKKDRGEKKAERRPFDRDIDLGSVRLNEAQRRSVVDKARLLDTRFATGHSKYL